MFVEIGLNNAGEFRYMETHQLALFYIIFVKQELELYDFCDALIRVFNI